MSITLHSTQPVFSGISGNNGGISTINWINFADVAPLAALYKYFEIQSCRIRFSMSTVGTTSDSFYSAAIAWFPINYNIEAFSTTAPVSEEAVSDLPGSVYVRNATMNQGPWFSPMIKAPFATSDAFGTGTPRAAGNLIWYVNDAGITETLGRCDIEITLRFYQREYTGGVGLLRPQKSLQVVVDDKNKPQEEFLVIRSCK
jgi:hypothetical protein